MAYRDMYAGINNSPVVELASDITATDTSITVSSGADLPDAPNLITIGNDENAELVKYNGKTGNTLTGCERGFCGTLAQVWASGTPAGRNFTTYDYNALVDNLLEAKAENETLKTKVEALEALASAPIKWGQFENGLTWTPGN